MYVINVLWGKRKWYINIGIAKLSRCWLNWRYQTFSFLSSWFCVIWEGDDRGWDGWIASLTQWTWVWISSRNWWWTGKPGVLQSMGSLRVGHGWTTELNWYMCYSLKLCFMLYTSGSVLCYRGKIVGYYNERTVFDTHLNLKILSNTYLNMLFKKHDSILMIFLGILSL